MLVEVGSIVEGKVTGITKFGAFIQLPEGKTGLVHISEIAEEFVKDIYSHLKESQMVKVKILNLNENGKISLSIRKAMEQKPRIVSSRPMEIDFGRGRTEGQTFEDKLAKWKKDSDEKMHDLKKSLETKRGTGYKKPSQNH